MVIIPNNNLRKMYDVILSILFIGNIYSTMVIIVFLFKYGFIKLIETIILQFYMSHHKLKLIQSL